MRYCGSCGAQNEDAGMFCAQCGANLNGDQPMIPIPPTGTMNCKKCGALLQPGCDFCPDCGTKRDGTPPASGNEQGTGKTKKKGAIIAVVVVLVVAALGAAAFFVLPKFLNQPSDNRPHVTEPSTTNAPVNMTEEDEPEIPTDAEEETWEEETTEALPELPEELRQYADRLVPENRTYVIDLGYDDWYINYRSSPEYIDEGKPGYNWAGKIVSGTEIFVEYICDGTWAVYWQDGRYVYSSIYDCNDPSMEMLMRPID